MPTGLDNLKEAVGRAFTDRYGGQPDVWVRSPGRVNLIGEHTDYNDGFVLPIAIERQTLLAARRRPDTTVRVFSLNTQETDEFAMDRLEHGEGWRDYLRGVVWALREAGYHPPGVDIALASDVPMGGGLSSSASFEVGLGWTLAQAGKFDVPRVDLALLSRRTENEWVGVATGIMDQFIVALGRADHALLIDTRDLSYELIPMPTGVSVVIADTGIKRGLVSSEYNARRAETAEAARRLGLKSLRDISWDEFKTRGESLPDLLQRRARHVVGENERVLHTVAAFRRGDVETVGNLMNESHHSLQHDYAVSHPNLDQLVEIARRVPGVYGARMTGAGFGGATVSLVTHSAVDAFQREVSAAYEAATGITPPIYVTRATDGVGRITS